MRALKYSSTVLAFIAAACTLTIAGCGGKNVTEMLNTGGGAPESVNVPKGTITGGASAGQATALAQEIADTNNNTMQQFNKMGGQMSSLQSTENQELKNSQAALAKLNQLSQQQGTGSITLFFAEGSARLNPEQTQRLIRFLDYLQRESRGRKVILVSIGSASAVGSASINAKLSRERSEAPLATIDQYLVNTPHKYFKVTGIGDMYAPKGGSTQVENRYQSVEIIAAYDAAQLGSTPGY
jgi:outer membrane protein OmpA-like peptidoglycan-associated protein